jgi:hypothetical protein
MSNPSVNKRQKEKIRQERQREKQLRRQQRTKAERPKTDELGNLIDPDIAGIVPGPQPSEAEAEEERIE